MSGGGTRSSRAWSTRMPSGRRGTRSRRCTANSSAITNERERATGALDAWDATRLALAAVPHRRADRRRSLAYAPRVQVHEVAGEHLTQTAPGAVQPVPAR